MRARRPNGISVLLASQNAALTVALSIRSFLEFADEIIVVDNGSTDGSVEIIQELAARHDKVRFYDAPWLRDLYENRQYAFERSRYRWVCRFDSDYVAYTDGPRDVRNLRRRILAQAPGLRPVAFTLARVNLHYDYWHTAKHPPPPDRAERHLDPPISAPEVRVYQHYAGLRFARLGRREGVRWGRLYKRIAVEQPYWFHCNFKRDVDYLFRSERTNWRQLGDFARFPTLESYVRHAIRVKYGTDDIELATQRYLEREIFPLLAPFDPARVAPYPSLIEEAMKTATRKR